MCSGCCPWRPDPISSRKWTHRRTDGWMDGWMVYTFIYNENWWFKVILRRPVSLCNYRSDDKLLNTSNVSNPCPPLNRWNPLNLFFFPHWTGFSGHWPMRHNHFLMPGWTFRDGRELNHPNGSSCSFAAGIDQRISIAGQSAKLTL